MSIRTQVALGCGVMVIVVAAFAGYSRTLNHDVAANIAVVAERAMPQVQAAGDLAAAFAGVEAARQQVVAANAVAEHDDTYPIDTPPGQTEPAKAARRGLARAITVVEERLAEVRALATASAAGPRPELQTIDEEFAAYRADIDNLVAELEHGSGGKTRDLSLRGHRGPLRPAHRAGHRRADAPRPRGRQPRLGVRGARPSRWPRTCSGWRRWRRWPSPASSRSSPADR